MILQPKFELGLIDLDCRELWKQKYGEGLTSEKTSFPEATCAGLQTGHR